MTASNYKVQKSYDTTYTDQRETQKLYNSYMGLQCKKKNYTSIKRKSLEC